MMEPDPPQPEFSIKGRTVQSMLRLMQDWHRSLGLGSDFYPHPKKRNRLDRS
jgi:hypothetical protein